VNLFDISILDASVEGILWLKLVHKLEHTVVLPCVCYLPPENSSRTFDVNGFYEHLLTNIYEYKKEGLIFICGDFNSRCGTMDDFIVGVDDVPQRSIIDYSANSYGELLIDFLINTNMIMLNGRKSSNNNFTSVSVKGSSVVDYCLIPQEKLDVYTDFNVILTTDLINKHCSIGSVGPSCMPDHSFLTWNVSIKSVLVSCDQSHVNSFDKFELKNVPQDFMNNESVLIEINKLIDTLETNAIDTHNIDDVYTSWCNIVKDNMYDNIPYRTIRTRSSNISNFKKFRGNKPWWNDNLAILWSNLCSAEAE